MVLTNSSLSSFVDWDMLMRHFGQGIRHLQYERQPETEPEMAIDAPCDKADDDVAGSDKEGAESDLDVGVEEMDEDGENDDDDDVSESEESDDHDSMGTDDRDSNSDTESLSASP